jgi:hypothetical protein
MNDKEFKQPCTIYGTIMKVEHKESASGKKYARYSVALYNGKDKTTQAYNPSTFISVMYFGDELELNVKDKAEFSGTLEIKLSEVNDKTYINSTLMSFKGISEAKVSKPLPKLGF